MTQALRWHELGEKQSFLLRGFNYENAKTWLRLYKDRNQHAPLDIHKQFILASEAAKGQLGTDIFVSYSRKDGDLARELNRKLQEAGKTTWFDQESISKGVDFEKEIFKGINGCDNFVFIISPDSIASEYCEREVEYAVSQNKRMLPLIARETKPETIPEALRIINWIDFKDTDFSKAFADLVQAVELDREHASIHTMLQQRASEWNEHDNSPDFLLNTTACNNAERWLTIAYDSDVNNIYADKKKLNCNKTPAPTNLQINFINASRKSLNAAIAKEKKRARRIIALVTGAAIISIVLAIYGLTQKSIADDKTLVANSKQDSVRIVLKEVEEEKLKSDKLFLEANERKKDLEKAIDAITQSQRITEKVSTYLSFNENYAPVRSAENKKYGYIDDKGNLLIDYKFDDAQTFKEGLAKITINKKTGFINKSGKIVIDTIFDDASSFSDGLAWVKKEKKCGFINKTGKLLIPHIYEEASDFENGNAKVKKNGMYGVIDKSGKNIISCQFDEIVSNNSTSDFFECKKGKKNYKVKKGNIFAGNISEMENYVIIKQKNGLRLITMGGFADRRAAFINSKNEIVSLWFNRVYEFSEGLAKVKIKGKFGFVNKNGVVIINAIYHNATDLKNGKSEVFLLLEKPKRENNNYYIFKKFTIDKNGKKIEKYGESEIKIDESEYNY